MVGSHHFPSKKGGFNHENWCWYWFMVGLLSFSHLTCHFQTKPMCETAQHIVKILEPVILLSVRGCKHVELDSAVIWSHRWHVIFRSRYQALHVDTLKDHPVFFGLNPPNSRANQFALLSLLGQGVHMRVQTWEFRLVPWSDVLLTQVQVE